MAGTKKKRAARLAAGKPVALSQNEARAAQALLDPFLPNGTRQPDAAGLLEVFAAIAGGKSLRQAAAGLGYDAGNCLRAIRKSADPKLAEAYDIATELSALSRFDRLGQVANLVLTGKITPEIARAFSDIEKWNLAKLRPEKFGDKITQELTGPGGGPVGMGQAVIIVLEDNGRPRSV